MSGAGPRRGPLGDVTVSVQADLTIDLDGTAATLTGDGDRFVLATEKPGALVNSLTGVTLPAGVGSVPGPVGVGRIAEALREAGVNLVVRGPRGTVASLGAGVDSALGRALVGSGALRPGAPAAVGPLVWQAVRRRPAARVAGLALAIAAGFVLVRRARSR